MGHVGRRRRRLETMRHGDRVEVRRIADPGLAARFRRALPVVVRCGYGAGGGVLPALRLCPQLRAVRLHLCAAGPLWLPALQRARGVPAEPRLLHLGSGAPRQCRGAVYFEAASPTLKAGIEAANRGGLKLFVARTGSADRTPATPIGANPVVVRPAPAAEERPAGSLFGDRGEVLARGRYVACPARGLRV